MSIQIAIIGAGISGLTCARKLSAVGRRAVVFEKSRGVGGRMATRRTPEGYRFDHGAQYFTVRDDKFAQEVAVWEQLKHVALWNGVIGSLDSGSFSPKENPKPRYVGVPAMNSACKHLAEGIDIRLNTRIQPPNFSEGAWHLRDDEGNDLGNFEALIVSAPAAQTAELAAEATEIRAAAERVKIDGCWAVMLAFDKPLPLEFDGAFVENSPLSWICRNSSKPGRETTDCWVVHASPGWSQDQIDRSPELVLTPLLEAFWQATGVSKVAPLFCAAHRWRYSIPVEPLESHCVEDPAKKAIACGDWCGGPRVEGAYLSGLAAAERLLGWYA